MEARSAVRAGAALVMSAAAIAAAGTAATGAVTERGRYHETWTETYAPGEEFAGCTFDFPLTDSLDAWINVTGVVRAGGIWYYNGTLQEVETFTNPDTGKTFTRVHNGSDRDQRIVDNGDGTLTITVQATGPNTYYADGERLFTDTGVVRFSVLVDHNGTPADPEDDTFLEYLGLDKFSGLSQTDGRDFCEDLRTFIG